MVPPEFLTFFIASTGAGAALVGLLFVAVSLAPEQIVASRAPVERQAVAGSAFTALVNAFFISLVALIPHVNFGAFVTDPTQVGYVYGLLFVLLGIIALGLTRAWELPGAQRYGFGGWLSPLRDVPGGESVAHEEPADVASGPLLG